MKKLLLAFVTALPAQWMLGALVSCVCPDLIGMREEKPVCDLISV